MADFVFVIEVSGFQQGELPFYVKRLSIALVRAGSCHTFNTDFLHDHEERALSTYRFATRMIHGINLDEPGLAYELRTLASKRLIPEYHHAPQVLLLTKGQEKLKIVEDLILDGGVFANFLFRDLSDYGCPPAHRLLGHQASTATTAALFASWFAGRYRNFPAPSLSPPQPTQEEDWED